MQGKSLVQLMCITFVKPDSLDANTSVPIGFVIYACDYGYTASNVVAMIVIINGRLLLINCGKSSTLFIMWACPLAEMLVNAL